MKELAVEAKIDSIPEITEFINAELDKLGCPVKARNQLDIAIDELFSNISHYAYSPTTGPATVLVDVEEEPPSVIVTFIDSGKPYDPLANSDPDVTLNAEERQIGGLGVFLVKKSMDAVEYEYKNGQNILRIKKNIQ